MKKIGVILVIGVCCMLFSGCMDRSRVAHLTVMASKNISTLEGAQNMGSFEGKDCKTAFKGQMPSQLEALDRAVEAGNGNAMVDVVIYFKPAVCAFDDVCWEVKGTVIKTKDFLKKAELKNQAAYAVGPEYTREIITSPSGREYLALKNKSDVDLNNDQKHYDLLMRIR
jgi:hypothetical protein